MKKLIQKITHSIITLSKDFHFVLLLLLIIDIIISVATFIWAINPSVQIPLSSSSSHLEKIKINQYQEIEKNFQSKLIRISASTKQTN